MMMERDGRTAYNPYCQTAKHDTDAMEASGRSGQGVATERDEQRSGVTDISSTPSISVSGVAVAGSRRGNGELGLHLLLTSNIVALALLLHRLDPMKLFGFFRYRPRYFLSAGKETERKYSLLLAR